MAKKESGKPSLSYDEAVEEALCFGGIDSVVNKLDTERYKQLFSPRKAKSNWLRLNKERVARLLSHVLMGLGALSPTLPPFLTADGLRFLTT
ncbi:MAG: hypothetical protein DYG88_16840 [Chloroflexi bacterium CFX4]|nr:hypothetical protein [Chloroflexi bacterium CFX4]MDL1922380.1 hypothetical protein [Chloroflexi bacterium CFX3]